MKVFERIRRRGIAAGLVVSLAATWISSFGLATVRASDTPTPSSVTVAGSLQSELGCSGDWQPECTATQLAFDAEDGVWQGTFVVPAGNWEYKAPLNGTWDENYGDHATRNGSNIALNLASAESVKFYYSHETHWITSNHNAVIVTAPGSYQTEMGCPGDWQPDCLRSWLQDPDGDGIYTFTTRSIPAGTYETKAAINESWTENYGEGGVQNGPNISFTVPSNSAEMLFRYDAATHVLTVGPAGAPPQPSSVTVAGSLQSELGCSGDWQPECTATQLAFDAEDGVWQGAFVVPAGNWEYKAPLNGTWDENYGDHATRNGSNIALNLASAESVKFYYSHETHWITSNHNAVIVTAPGSYQTEMGCPGDWQPDCLRSWLQDPDGDGIYTFTTRSIPAGTYETKAAINESWTENYGEGGVQNGPNISFTVPNDSAEVAFVYNATTHVLTVSTQGAPKGNLAKAKAYWVSRDTIAWSVAGAQPGWDVRLHYAPEGGLGITTEGVVGGVDIPLTFDPAGLPADVREKFPHIAGSRAYRIPADHLAEVPEALRSQVAVSAKDGGVPVDATSLQIPGVLDDLYGYDGALGATFEGGAPTLRVWAPTARSVKLHLFDDSNPASASTVVAMTPDAATGVWSVAGGAAWRGKYYLYEVEVFVRATGQIEHNLVTDPYSLSLSTNSQRSQIVDLADPTLAPAGWGAIVKPALEAPEDIVLYELHVRDFSAEDATVPAPLRGTFKAFTLAGSNGMRHLASLARAGLTHVHLLPAFDIASVNENKAQWEAPAGDLAGFAPDSTEQQAAVSMVADRDGFNWGYDPLHYTVPEGSYATNPDGAARVVEFREMVKGLNNAGLRVVMDVVYNHTTAAGQNPGSVLDKIVPGYYYRLDGEGNITNSSCCPNTASEHDMMEKLLVDSVLTWAKFYKVDGFRFDIMGFHMKRNLVKLRQALDALTLASDGVDGRKIYLYGEGWNFGEVANDARGVNAIQRNMAGTGIGTFSDRMRDGVRGGGPFSGLQEQGFLTGLFYDPNATNQGSPAEQRARLLAQTDWIRVGLAGNLAAYTFVDRFGNTVTGAAVDYNGQPAGYTADPQEVINYIDAHDNETLFDTIQLKAPVATTMAGRVRMENLGLSLVTLGEGIPFVHAGAELLRSKSLDRNSYNSGDWFNRLDFTYTSNNWGVGLPPAGDNFSNWPIMGPLLANPALRPAPADITSAFDHFREALAVRRSSRLFRLRTAAEIVDRVRFHNTGPDQLAGLVAMEVSDAPGSVDRQYLRVVVLFNANDEAQTLHVAHLAGRSLGLHPIQAVSSDPVVRTSSFIGATGAFSVPGRTAAVFVELRPAIDRVLLLSGDVDALVASGALSSGQGNSLKAKLAVARAQLARGNTTAAATQLRAFVNQLESLVAEGVLTAGQAAPLVAEAASILAQVQR